MPNKSSKVGAAGWFGLAVTLLKVEAPPVGAVMADTVGKISEWFRVVPCISFDWFSMASNMPIAAAFFCSNVLLIAC